MITLALIAVESGLALTVAATSSVRAGQQPPYILNLLPAAPPSQQAYHNATLSSCELNMLLISLAPSNAFCNLSLPHVSHFLTQGAATS